MDERFVPLVKAHAYGNDFLIVETAAWDQPADVARFARRVCDRHRGLGADGLMVVSRTPDGASMRLWNADGSRSELSGNGVRCVAAWLADADRLSPGAILVVHTEAGPKRLELIARTDAGWSFEADMGQPEGLRQERLTVGADEVTTIVMRVGNPQCVVLGAVTDARLASLGSALSVHPFFPEGTNVELATVEAPDRVRILIWERGVGPTEASGTGACAAAVAAAAYGGALRRLDVVAPGGTQRVEWTDAGLCLTGTAELIARAEWLGAGTRPPPAA